jgi:hypothetical protein
VKKLISGPSFSSLPGLAKTKIRQMTEIPI